MEKTPANKARQGRSGAQVLIVLVVSLAVAGAVWLGVEFYGEAMDAGGGARPVEAGAGQNGF
ncbi:hypothetical protein [Mesorhizobium marinum]|uniref:Uncharacterized protein n=1 Tax=Mesorhizobium marinum TaxID=3228790 RepID=A0ABV3QXG0_9HYPH